MEPPDTQVTSSVLALLAYYKWFKFTIVYQDDGRWDTIAEHLITQAENRNFTINNSTSFKDSTACCVANPPLPCCNEVSVIFILITVASFHQKKITELDFSINPGTKSAYSALIMWVGSSKTQYFLDF